MTQASWMPLRRKTNVTQTQKWPNIKEKKNPLGTSHISPRSTIVKVIPPNIINPSLNVIAIGVIGKNPKIWQGYQVVVPIHNLHVPKIWSFSKPFTCKMSTTHLGRSVRPWLPWIHHFSSKLHHACMIP